MRCPEMARFYAAEMILGIQEAHRLGFIHRCAETEHPKLTRQRHQAR